MHATENNVNISLYSTQYCALIWRGRTDSEIMKLLIRFTIYFLLRYELGNLINID